MQMDGIKKSPRLIFSETKAPGPGWPITVTVNGDNKSVTHEGLNNFFDIYVEHLDLRCRYLVHVISPSAPVI